ncbi:MAG: PAS domain S-box protein [Proteobacteria bacterium]|nr:PAS domain S-box protein [Pseudomonadota bacterium]
MTLSYRTTRNMGFLTLLLIIIFESILIFSINAKNSERLSSLIKVDQVKLSTWYDVAEIINNAKDRLNDFRLGKSALVAPIDLLVNRAMTEVGTIKKISVAQEDRDRIDEIVGNIRKLKQAVFVYSAEVQEGYRGGSSAREIEDIAVATADHIGQLTRAAVAFETMQITEKQRQILAMSNFSKKLLAIILVVGVISVLVVAFLLERAISKPLEILVDGTRRLALGNLDHRVNIESADEIGVLASSFNTMTAELKISHYKMQKAKTYVDNILKSMNNILVVVGPDGVVQTVNQVACDILGYEEEYLVGQPLSLILKDYPCEEEGLGEIFAKDYINNRRTNLITQDGKTIETLLSSSVMRDEEGQVQGIICVAQDVTIQNEALRAGHLASIGELAAGVAHEINNPVNGIINFAQLLIDECDQSSPQSKEMLQRIINEGDRVASIVSSLLSFARKGEDHPGKETIFLQEIMKETLCLAEVQTRKDGIVLEIDIPENLPAMKGNLQQMMQVFLNIMNNARYALNEKFPKLDPNKILRITASKERVDSQDVLQIVFYDQGVGIPAKFIDKIANPFFSTKPAGSGTGLGLAISYGIVKDHGGKMNIVSQEGCYCEITFQFPVGG